MAVVGNSGSGKSTMAERLADALGVAWIELDSIFHQPNWTELPADELRLRVERIVAGDGWVVDGNYKAVRDVVWMHADTVVWLDLPRRVVMLRIVWRTLSRVVLRRRLWNGNREPLRNLATLDPERSIIAWSWVKHAEYRATYAEMATDPEWAHLSFVRLRTRREAARWLAQAVKSARVSERHSVAVEPP